MFITAIILGFAGSLHCAGMCSPLAFAAVNRSGAVMLNRVLYNLGRILMYSVMGAVASTAGLMLSMTVQFALSISLGIVLLLIGVTGLNFKMPVFAPALKFNLFLKTKFSTLLQNKKHSSIFAMGVLNGLLPCGLTFLALTSCIALSGPVEGFLFMILFGLGTVPVMVGWVSILPLITKKLKISTVRLSTVLQIVAGCLLIARVLLIAPQHYTAVPGSNQIVICR